MAQLWGFGQGILTARPSDRPLAIWDFRQSRIPRDVRESPAATTPFPSTPVASAFSWCPSLCPLSVPSLPFYLSSLFLFIFLRFPWLLLPLLLSFLLFPSLSLSTATSTMIMMMMMRWWCDDVMATMITIYIIFQAQCLLIRKHTLHTSVSKNKRMK